MTTAHKLWLGFGTMTALLAVSGVAILVRVRNIEGLVHEQADVARPRSVSTRQLEINVLNYTLNIHYYLRSGDQKTRQIAKEQADGVERHLAEYEQFVATSLQRELATRCAATWKEIYALGQTVMDAENRQPRQEDLARLYDLRIGFEKFLDEEMQVNSVDIYNARKNATLQNVESIVQFALILLVGGVLTAVATGWAVGRGIVKVEQALRQAHDALEGRVRERTAELTTVNDALQRSNRELEQFASVASHDLQEPLRKIQAFGDRLQTKCAEKLGEQGGEYLERILESAIRMRTLIDDLLLFSRVANKSQPFVPISLTALAREAVSDLESRIQQTGGRVEIGDLPTLDADPSQMRQVLQNLIANALKFHRPGTPPVVRVRGRMLSNGAAGHNSGGRSGPLCEIAVEDNGIGFEEVYLDRIFELFQRLHGRNEYEGTGMGLAICRKIVERHGGQITAKSTPGQGATFLVTLPVRQPRGENKQ